MAILIAIQMVAAVVNMGIVIEFAFWVGTKNPEINNIGETRGQVNRKFILMLGAAMCLIFAIFAGMNMAKGDSRNFNQVIVDGDMIEIVAKSGHDGLVKVGDARVAYMKLEGPVFPEPGKYQVRFKGKAVEFLPVTIGEPAAVPTSPAK